MAKVAIDELKNAKKLMCKMVSTGLKQNGQQFNCQPFAFDNCTPVGTRTQIYCLGGGYSILLNYGSSLTNTLLLST